VALPVTTSGALLPLDAPLPQPRRYTLLDAAQIVNSADERWLAGAWINGYPSGRPRTHDPCSTGTYRLKSADAGAARPMVGSFTVVQGGSCTAKSVGPDATWYKDRLSLAFQAVEATAVERMLATGDGHGGNLGAYIGDANMDAPVGNTPQTRREGLAILETEIAKVGNGIIHATPATATLWRGDYLIDVVGGQLRTGIGTLVVVGAGYIGARPDAYGGLGATQDWAFATGFIQVRRDEITILPGQYSEALDRVSNELTFYAERDYLLSWVGRQDNSDAEHIQAGVLIDRTT
jgi:hypothetical protein